jgi:hypothetical protein
MSYPRVSLFVVSLVPSALNDGSKLVTMDGKKTEIARLHRARGCRKKRKAQLEVQPAGMGMLDQIIVTLVFVEQRRRERVSATSTG